MSPFLIKIANVRWRLVSSRASLSVSLFLFLQRTGEEIVFIRNFYILSNPSWASIPALSSTTSARQLQRLFLTLPGIKKHLPQLPSPSFSTGPFNRLLGPHTPSLSLAVTFQFPLSSNQSQMRDYFSCASTSYLHKYRLAAPTLTSSAWSPLLNFRLLYPTCCLASTSDG